MALPNGLDEIVARYGNPFPMAAMPAEWEKRYIVNTTVPPGLLTYLGHPILGMRINKVIQNPLRDALVSMVRAQLGPIAFGRAYEWEVVGDELGVHSWGIAIHLGVPGVGPVEQVAAILVGNGWAWSDTDKTHFQLATGYWVE